MTDKVASFSFKTKLTLSEKNKICKNKNDAHGSSKYFHIINKIITEL